jgi:transposase InsO family protein
MGRTPNPWRTVEAGNRRGGAHGLQADPEAANTAVADLAQFLTNHVRDLVAIDFFTVPTAHWRVLFVLVVLAHHRRRILHFNVTEHPTAEWTAQQIVDAFPEDTAPSYLLRDRDTIYGHAFRQRVTDMRILEVLTAAHSPWQNPFVERLIGSVRRDCLDHVLVPPVRDVLSGNAVLEVNIRVSYESPGILWGKSRYHYVHHALQPSTTKWQSFGAAPPSPWMGRMSCGQAEKAT